MQSLDAKLIEQSQQYRAERSSFYAQLLEDQRYEKCLRALTQLITCEVHWVPDYRKKFSGPALQRIYARWQRILGIPTSVRKGPPR